MDPITIIGIGGAGYLALRAKQKADDNKASATPAFTSPKTGSLVASGDGFKVGAPAAIQKSQPPDIGKILGTIGGVLGTTLTLVTVVGGGSMAAGFSAIAGIGAAGAIVVLWIIAVVAVVVAGIFVFIQEADHTADALRRGTADYMAKLLTTAHGIANAILKMEAQGEHANSTAKPISETVAQKFATCFAFAACRGFNRGKIANCVASAAYKGATDRDIYGIIERQSLYSLVVHEEGWITRPSAIIAQQASILGFTQHACLEDQLFPGSSFEQAKAELGDMWPNTFTQGNAEDSADFLGRALACRAIITDEQYSGEVYDESLATGGVLMNPKNNAVLMVANGVIGRKHGLAGEGAVSLAQVAHGTSDAPIVACMNESEGYVRDLDGNSGLKWFYNESDATGLTVVR